MTTDPALWAAVNAVVSRWIDDETGMVFFDSDLIDQLAEALAAAEAAPLDVEHPEQRRTCRYHPDGCMNPDPDPYGYRAALAATSREGEG